MVKLYADLVEAGRRSLDGANGVKKVPDKYIADVIKELEIRGYFDNIEENEPVEEVKTEEKPEDKNEEENKEDKPENNENEKPVETPIEDEKEDNKNENEEESV